VLALICSFVTTAKPRAAHVYVTVKGLGMYDVQRCAWTGSALVICDVVAKMHEFRVIGGEPVLNLINQRV
jgi:hypothetical protein